MIKKRPAPTWRRRLDCAISATALATTAIATTALSAQTTTRSKNIPVNVTGVFREDGTCQVFADGVAVFHPVDSAQTTYIRGGMLNTAPSGYETHEVWCTARTTDQPMPPLDYTERVFVVMVSARSGELARRQSYQVRTGLATIKTAAQQANAALFGMTPQILDDSIPVRIGLMYLAGTRGTFVVTRVDSTRVVGTFAMRGQRALTM